MNNTISYRGASADQSEVRIPQLLQQQGSRLVQYRGNVGEASIGQVFQKRTISYRGAKADMNV